MQVFSCHQPVWIKVISPQSAILIGMISHGDTSRVLFLCGAPDHMVQNEQNKSKIKFSRSCRLLQIGSCYHVWTGCCHQHSCTSGYEIWFCCSTSQIITLTVKTKDLSDFSVIIHKAFFKIFVNKKFLGPYKIYTSFLYHNGSCASSSVLNVKCQMTSSLTFKITIIDYKASHFFTHKRKSIVEPEEARSVKMFGTVLFFCLFLYLTRWDSHDVTCLFGKER